MIGRADIEGSKSNVAMNAWLPHSQFCLPRLCRDGTARTVANAAVDLNLAERSVVPRARKSLPVTSGLPRGIPEPDATSKDERLDFDSSRMRSLRDNWSGPPIPVVTFLAPLASNFEGLKDR